MLIASGTAAVVVSACSSDDTTEPAATVAGVPAGVPTVTTAARDPFCDAIVELDGRSAEQAPGAAAVLDVYDAIAAEAPDEIGADFAIVRDRLAAVVEGEEVGDDPAEDEAVERFTAWVDLECRGTSRTPLPPPTQPGTDD